MTVCARFPIGVISRGANSASYRKRKTSERHKRKTNFEHFGQMIRESPNQVKGAKRSFNLPCCRRHRKLVYVSVKSRSRRTTRWWGRRLTPGRKLQSARSGHRLQGQLWDLASDDITSFIHCTCHTVRAPPRTYTTAWLHFALGEMHRDFNGCIHYKKDFL